MTKNPIGVAPAVSLTLLPDHLSIYRFDPLTALDDIGQLSGLWSITRTRKELSGCAVCTGAVDGYPLNTTAVISDELHVGTVATFA